MHTVLQTRARPSTPDRDARSAVNRRRLAGVRVLLLIMLAVLALAGCGQEQAAAPDPGQAAEAEAAEAAALYHQLRQLGRLEQAELAGRNVLENHPDSAAAAEVRQTYEALRQQVETEREASRIAALWVYHAIPEEAGTVRTATIHRSGDDSSPAADPSAENLRLVLRQHPEWGQAVYLLASNADFECGEQGCTAQVAFDEGEASDWKATVSREGPLPALFIEDDARFIEQLQQADWVSIEAPMSAEPARPLRFEVSGFERAQWTGEQVEAEGEAAPAPADEAPASGG